MNNHHIYQLISTLLLAALLFIPVSKIIWAMSVRRLQRKLNHELSHAQAQAQLKRARFIALFIVLLFSYLFNSSLMRQLYE